eukprot:CAMPEP_0169083234 /NCGR_PEP_ID=MMETSP1015-20121227/11973_1 /TAXON_ID=342587 /ORGANISM="Karlodinium micrum, Strain CCMP2283" /LENGTH=157 /DNA_ID=CAMNT_0009143151 /DNA_START=227 /DNA_END=700 /DNA_ORIENTATION=+
MTPLTNTREALDNMEFCDIADMRARSSSCERNGILKRMAHYQASKKNISASSAEHSVVGLTPSNKDMSSSKANIISPRSSPPKSFLRSSKQSPLVILFASTLWQPMSPAIERSLRLSVSSFSSANMQVRPELPASSICRESMCFLKLGSSLRPAVPE